MESLNQAGNPRGSPSGLDVAPLALLPATATALATEVLGRSPNR